MTAKLIALISIVLLVTLGSFAALMLQYQQQLMAGLEATVSEASRATLKQIDMIGANPSFALLEGEPLPAELIERIQNDASGTEEERIERSERTIVGPDGVERRVVTIKRSAGPQDAEGFTHAEQDERVMIAFEERHDVSADLTETQMEAIRHSDQQEIDPAALRELLEKRSNTFFFDVDAIDVKHGEGAIVLQIPMLADHRWQAAGGDAGSAETEKHVAKHASADGTVSSKASWREVSVEVPTEEFATLNKSLRNRALAVFFGVFVLGTVLAGSLATRFTRPVRRLDRALNRLSEGDLDVTVPSSRSGDEIGRLGHAFNEMAAKLKIHRARERDVHRRERLSALGMLAAGVAHDVRNPLHSIKLTLHHMRDACAPSEPDAVREFGRSVATMEGEIERLDQLVGEFLRFARAEPAHHEPTDIERLLRDVARLVDQQARDRGVEIVVESQDDLPELPVERAALSSSIINLVVNSLDAMQQGGRITLTNREERGLRIVEVRDQGSGIAEEHLERVFDLGYTTRESGHGIGLAMVHHVVVSEHGGTVEIDSSDGGTTVRIALPATREESAA